MSDKNQKSPLKKYIASPVLKKTSLQAAGGLGGLSIAYAVDRTANAQKGWIIPTIMLGLGLTGLHYFNVNPPKESETLLQLAQGTSAGVAMYGGLRTFEYGLPKITANGMNGLRGFIPKPIAEKIARYLPTFNGMGEVKRPSGYYDDPMASMMGTQNNTYYQEPSSGALPAVPINGNVEAENVVAEVL
ncbi:MAG: hypothetical protein F9K23_12305 [Bacteroidetes bacterium]|jgi:hypothetical protein|nr:MAG: hypothetical protein F9K23_12305 [Bacteroidota bacterium]